MIEQHRCAVPALVFSLLLWGVSICRAGEAGPDPVLIPQIDGPWWQVAGDPDLGELTDPEQQPVDFAVWQAADGTWQLWSCIRKTRCGGKTRLFHRWEGRKITDTDWKPMGIAMQADPKFGETPGGLQAPHVIKVDNVYYMFYGDWKHICLASSRDGKTFRRVLDDKGRPQLFTEDVETYANTRDPMVLPVGDTYYCYYCAFPHHKGAVYCRTSKDLRTWSKSTKVAFGGQAGTGPCQTECPHVVHRHGWYYLFHSQTYGVNAKGSVYRSKDPMNFGLDDDRFLVCTMPVATVEIFFDQGQEYIATLLPSLKGIRIARLKWMPKAVRGRGVFDFDHAEDRAAWRVTEGKIDPVFTTSTRQAFNPHFTHFIGTAESVRGGPDDAQLGVIESPPFVLQSDRYVLLVSGGSDRQNVYVALVEAESGREIVRATGRDHNTFQHVVVDTSKHLGTKARIRVVDRATESWGHVNFGGMFASPTGRR